MTLWSSPIVALLWHSGSTWDLGVTPSQQLMKVLSERINCLYLTAVCLLAELAIEQCQHSKVVQKGPKGTKMVNLSVFDHLGPILGPSGPFWTISDKNDFFAPNGQSRGWQRCFGAKYQFLFEWKAPAPLSTVWCPNEFVKWIRSNKSINSR